MKWQDILRDIGNKNYYHDVRYGYRSGNLTYIGATRKHKQSADAYEWDVWKLTWTGGEMTRKEYLSGCSWTGVTNGPIGATWA
jgi:hypothetical protein